MRAERLQHLRRRAAWPVLILALTGLSACSGGGGGGSAAPPAPVDAAPAPPAPSPAPAQPFEVVRADPPHGAVVGQLDELTLVFSEAIDPASVVQDTAGFNTGTFRAYIRNPGAPTLSRVGGALTVNGNELRFQPATSLSSGSELTITLSIGIRSASGTALSSGSVSGPLDLVSQTPDIVFQSSATFQAPAAFEVVQTIPAHGAVISSNTALNFSFSAALDPASIVHDASGFASGNLRVYTQPAASSSLQRQPGKLLISGSSIAFFPLSSFGQGDTVIVTLTDTITDLLGTPLSRGSVSGPLSLASQTPDIVFQAAFGVGAPPAINQPEDVSGAFQIFPGTDPWHIDFEVYTDPYSFEGSLLGHGLTTVGPSEAARWVRHRVIARTLEVSSVLYLREADGRPVSGTSYRVSFAANAPSGQPGIDYSRMGVGGPSDIGALGAALTIDFGNLGREDNVQPGVLGVSASDIFGDNSVLSPPLEASDLRFVDGSYALGAGSSADDARFLQIREVIEDYGFALGFVNAHEVGHLVGLEHDTTDNLNIMFPAAISISDPRARFGPGSTATLNNNLGRDS